MYSWIRILEKTAKSSAEKDFYKLLNNSNFGNDCRNNIGNCKTELLYNGLDEIHYIKKFTNIFQNSRYREFFSIDLLKKRVNNEFKEKCGQLDKSDPFYNSIHESLTQKLDEDLEHINCKFVYLNWIDSKGNSNFLWVVFTNQIKMTRNLFWNKN